MKQNNFVKIKVFSIKGYIISKKKFKSSSFHYLNFYHIRQWNALQYELSYAIASLHFEVDITVVEENYAYIAPVVIVHYTRRHINRVFPR